MKKNERNNKEENRIKIIMTFISSLFIVLLIYMSCFQIFKAEKIANNTYNQRLSIYEDNIHRGKFLDRNREVLAYNTEVEQGKYVRFYPYGRLYSHIIGYSDTQYGKAGLERSVNNLLLNVDTSTPIRQIKKWVEDNSEGNDIVLTIDTGLQNYAYQLLEGHKGAIVALNPKNGGVYTMVSRPSFDPNHLAESWETLLEDENSPLLNRATQGLYTPGSIFKVITASAILENKNISKEYNDTGEVFVQGEKIQNYNQKSYGEVGLREALMYSINTYFAQKGLDLGPESLDNMTKQFHFNQPIPFDIPTNSSVSGFAKGVDDVDVASASFGQGKTLVTPLNMAMVAATISNQGKMVQPKLIKEVRDHNGNVTKRMQVTNLNSVLSPDVSRQLSSYMVDTIDAGSLASLPGVKIGGKTGTAETTSGTTHAWFIAFAPMENPKVAVAVVLEEDGSFGAETAAPIAREIINYVLYQIQE